MFKMQMIYSTIQWFFYGIFPLFFMEISLKITWKNMFFQLMSKKNSKNIKKGGKGKENNVLG